MQRRHSVSEREERNENEMEKKKSRFCCRHKQKSYDSMNACAMVFTRLNAVPISHDMKWRKKENLQCLLIFIRKN